MAQNLWVELLHFVSRHCYLIWLLLKLFAWRALVWVEWVPLRMKVMKSGDRQAAYLGEPCRTSASAPTMVAQLSQLLQPTLLQRQQQRPSCLWRLQVLRSPAGAALHELSCAGHLCLCQRRQRRSCGCGLL